jgi:flagellar hook assembly protein FlgD
MTNVSIVIYNSLGQEITRLLNNQEQNKGSYRVTWNGWDGSGKIVSSGIYFYQLKTNDVMMTKKMQLLK